MAEKGGGGEGEAFKFKEPAIKRSRMEQVDVVLNYMVLVGVDR